MFSLPSKVCLFFTLFAIARAAEHEFPSLDHARHIHGVLEGVDYVHRTGQFRTDKGERMDFAMPPYAVVNHRGAEADLR